MDRIEIIKDSWSSVKLVSKITGTDNGKTESESERDSDYPQRVGTNKIGKMLSSLEIYQRMKLFYNLDKRERMVVVMWPDIIQVTKCMHL